ncbi:MAG: hypothetical protein K8R58_03930 [Bacteroidales bacterium]|nr:hypothetical protein [Bacteroidales bacterium]
MFSLFSYINIFSQNTNIQDTIIVHDTTDITKIKYHSPHKATIYSLVLPGLGQAYNKKYWKIPVIYAGFGTLIYFITKNNKEYKLYRDAYNHKLISGDTLPPVNDYESKYDTDALQGAKDYYRRNLDLTYILTGLWYLINVFDATVDAHLFDWDVSNDLSLKLEPLINPITYNFKPTTGIKLTLNFK